MRKPFAQRQQDTLTTNAPLISILAITFVMAAWSIFVLYRPRHHLSLVASHSLAPLPGPIPPDLVRAPTVAPPIVADGKANPDKAEDTSEDLQSSVPIPSLFDRTLSVQEKSVPIGTDFIDAILRIEGIYDPTRIGLFGPSLRMQIRPGTMSMSNVFADQWYVAARDPNIHYRTDVLAETWLWPVPRDCEGFKRFRPDDSEIVFDRLSAQDCQAIKGPIETYGVVVSAPLSLPVFAAPYPGNRLSSADFISAQEAHVRAIRERLRLKWLNPV
jgi:hypothetical protein